MRWGLAMSELRPVQYAGPRLSKDQRLDRLVDLNTALKKTAPKHWASAPWPRLTYPDGSPKLCHVDSDGGSPKYITYRGRRMRCAELAFEIASAFAIQPGWRLEPLHCGNPLCVNPHHWSALIDKALDGRSWTSADSGETGFWMMGE